MKSNTGWFTTVAVALAAVFGISYLPSRRAAEPPANNTAQTANAGSHEKTPTLASLKKDLRSPCSEIVQRISKLLPENALAAPKSCFQNRDTALALTPLLVQQSGELRFMIATLPDPVHTHFSLLFDRLTEALQQSGQDQGYNYDSSWLPWIDGARQYGSLTDQQNAEELQAQQQAQPGILVFRKALPPAFAWQSSGNSVLPRPYDAGLIMFVVGENPTGGIDEEQFENAVDWIEALRPNGTEHTFRILGPFFSGSFPSLAHVLINQDVNDYLRTNKRSIAGRTLADEVGGVEVALRTLGPTLSLFVPALKPDELMKSFEQALLTNHEKIADADDALLKTTSSVEVFSGAATSQTGISWFSAFLSDERYLHLGRFRSFQENDNLTIDRFCRYLRLQGYDTGRLAIVSEDETAYGVIGANEQRAGSNHPMASVQDRPLSSCTEERGEGNLPSGPLYLYYPRDIATLRSAYEKQSIFGSGGQLSQPSSNSGLPQNLAEPSNSEHDTIRSYSGDQTALSQESTLFGMANLLGEHHIEFIVLRSSNTLDQIFLTRFFARAYPDARVVLTSSDLLFRRSSGTAGLRGTMTLTTYPLLTWQQDWTYWKGVRSRHSHRMFPQAAAEGLYDASRFLIALNDNELSLDLSKDAPLSIRSRVVVQDYGLPSWLLPKDPKNPPTSFVRPPTRPPTWLSVMGSGQLWPVAVLDESTIPPITSSRNTPPSPSSKAAPSLMLESTLDKAYTGAPYEQAELTLPLPFRVCLIVSFLWCCWHLYCCSRGSQTLAPRCLAYFAPVPGPQHKLLIFLGCALLAFWAVVLATLTGIFSHGGAPFWHHRLMALFYAVLVCLCLTALIKNYALPERRKKKSTKAEIDTMTAYATAKQAEQKAIAETREKQAEKEAREATQAGSGGQSPIVAQPVKPETTAISRPAAKIQKQLQRSLFAARRYLRQHPTVLLILAGAGLLLVVFSFGFMLHYFLTGRLSDATRVFTFWRSVNLFTGVSPMVPLLLLIAGMYAWFWYTLSGLALFNLDRPQLPSADDLDGRLPMFSRERTGKKIERLARPLSVKYALHLLLLLAVSLGLFAFFAVNEGFAVRSLGSTHYGRIFFVWLSLCMAMILTDAWQLLRTWTKLHQLLVFLDRTPLRRTLDALKGFSWGTVWKMGGSVLEQRYRLLSRQMESLRHLQNELDHWKKKNPGDSQILGDDFTLRMVTCDAARTAFVTWYGRRYDDPHLIDLEPLQKFQTELAKTAALVMKELILPSWLEERHSLILDFSQVNEEGSQDKKPEHPTAGLPAHLQAAEEFFALPYLGFIQNILGRMRTIAFGMLWLFVAATLSVASYPFDPRPVLSAIFLAVFVVVGAIVTCVYAGMHRDTTLSHITNTTPGQLGMDFWVKILGFGAGPLLGLITAVFPEIAGFATSWLQPSVEAIK